MSIRKYSEAQIVEVLKQVGAWWSASAASAGLTK